MNSAASTSVITIVSAFILYSLSLTLLTVV